MPAMYSPAMEILLYVVIAALLAAVPAFIAWGVLKIGGK